MKAYTDLEQSRKLAEFLPIESADMYYCYGMDIHTKKWDYDIVPTIIDASNQINIGDIPCWSLAPLMKIINSIDGFYPGIDAQVGEDNEWQICMFSYKTGCLDETAVINKDLLNACYEMIIKLNELKML